VAVVAAAAAWTGAGGERAAAATTSTSSTAAQGETPTLRYCLSAFTALQPFAKASMTMGSTVTADAGKGDITAALKALHAWSPKAASGATKMLAAHIPAGTSGKVRTDVRNLAAVMKTAAGQARTAHTSAQLTKLLHEVQTMDADITGLARACGVS